MLPGDLTQPDWNEPDSVGLALKALRDAHDEQAAVDATDRFLWSVGDNEAGTFWPVVLSTLPGIQQIVETGGPWARRATFEALIDLGGTFAPEEGHETHLGDPVHETVRGFIRALRPRVASLAAGSGPDVTSARELLELIDDLS